MRRAARTDDNHAAVVNALLEDPLVSVFSSAAVSAGFPDAVVGAFGLTHLVEIKDGTKPPSRTKLTVGQEKFHREWQGAPVMILASVDAARQWRRVLRKSAGLPPLKGDT